MVVQAKEGRALPLFLSSFVEGGGLGSDNPFVSDLITCGTGRHHFLSYHCQIV